MKARQMALQVKIKEKEAKDARRAQALKNREERAETDKQRQDKEAKRQQRELFRRRLQAKEASLENDRTESKEQLKLEKASHSVDAKEPVKFDLNGRKVRTGSTNTSNMKTRWSRG